MENRTTYTYDLIFKTSWHYSAKWRKNCSIYALLTGLLGAILIVGDQLIEEWHTSAGGGFFLICSLIAISSLLKNRKSKVSAAVSKQLNDNPNKIMHYQFQEDCIVINETSDHVRSDTRIDYSYIGNIVKIDDTSFYFATKASFLYVVCDETGIAELFEYVSSKVKPH